MALLSLTLANGGSFSLDENDIVKMYAKGSEKIVEYVDNASPNRIKVVSVDEALADLYAAGTVLIATTMESGSTIYLNSDRVITIEEVNSLARITYKTYKSFETIIKTGVTKAVLETEIGSNSSGLPYKSYVALLVQNEAKAPIATILENTLSGTPIWARSAQGSYTLTLSGEFTEDKTIALMGIGISDYQMGYEWIDIDSIRINTSDTALQSDSDDALEGTGIEIRVYD